MSFAFITPSFHGDYDLCVEMCRSMDRHASEPFEHVLAVPTRDLKRFAHLHSGPRTVIAQEAVLPRWLINVPAPAVVAIPGIGRKRLRSLWLTPRLRPVRGWLLQQVVKLSAERLTDAQNIIFVDSDAVFVRRFGRDAFMRQGALILHHEPSCIDLAQAEFQAWQDTACDLIGLERFAFNGDSYITALACWRREVLSALRERIEATTGRDMQTELLRRSDLSEYVLYGIFATRILGEASGQRPASRSLCHEDWAYNVEEQAGMDAFINGFEPHQIAVLMQSTNEWSLEKRRAVLGSIEERIAAVGDAPAPSHG